MQNPSMDPPPDSFNPFGQDQSDNQAQGPEAQNPMDQALMNLLTQGQDATPAQEALMGIGESIMSGLMSAANGGDSYGTNSDGPNLDSSSSIGGSNDGSNADSTSDATQSDNSDYPGVPQWMMQYAMSA
jgi:hypothetical protein